MLNTNGNTDKPLRAALYARVSTDDQRERQTIDTQTGALRNFAPHWDMTVVDEYLDDGISGTIRMEKRPEGARLMEDARERKFDVVIFYKLDRLARSLRHFLDMVDVFEDAGVGLRSMTETFDTTNHLRSRQRSSRSRSGKGRSGSSREARGASAGHASGFDAVQSGRF